MAIEDPVAFKALISKAKEFAPQREAVAK
jgi:hypothetical protein